MTSSDACKILLESIPNNIVTDTIELVFTNSKYVGIYDDSLEIETEERPNVNGSQSRDIIITFNNEKWAEQVLRRPEIVYKQHRFKPKPFVSKEEKPKEPEQDQEIFEEIHEPMSRKNLDQSMDDDSDEFVVVGNDSLMNEQKTQQTGAPSEPMITPQPELEPEPAPKKVTPPEKIHCEFDAVKFPFYLLNFNQAIFQELKHELKSDLNTSIRFENDQRKLVIESEGYNLDEPKVVSFVYDFLNYRFKTLEFEDEKWSIGMDTLLQIEADSNVCILLRNEPERRFLRIEGEFDQVARAKKFLSESQRQTPMETFI